MPSFRLDDYASVYSAPTAIPHESAPKGCVFRPFNDLDEAKAYADKVCEFFADSGAPAPVFVVRGPTSTTNAKYEVVDATSSYTIEYRVQPPDNVPLHATFADVILANNAKRPLQEQEKVHFIAACDMLAPKTNRELRELSISSCQDFLARGVRVSNPATDGSPGSELQLLARFLSSEWPESHVDAIEQLFKAYVHAGLVPVNATLNEPGSVWTEFKASSPLEYAVVSGKTRLMKALIEEGADYTAVPKEAYLNGAVLVQSGALLEFIKHQSHLGADVVDALHATAAEALMRRHITQAAAPAATEAVVNPYRNRRAAL